MDRRDFLKATAAGAAGLAIASCNNGKTVAQVSESVPGKMLENFPGFGALGFGCMRFPMYTGSDSARYVDQTKVDEMVDRAMAAGVNYFDSAPVYLQGKSEAATAAALSRYPRDSYYIATKLSNFRAEGNILEDGKAMYRRSLEIYGTDHIDFYLLHSLGSLEEFNKRFADCGLIDFLLKERADGHIRKLGYSFHGEREGFDELLSLHERYHWDFVQIQMNYVDWKYSDAEYMYNELEKRGIPVVIMEPLLGGALAKLPAALSFALKEHRQEASDASWALRFAADHKGVLTVLSGMTCMEHLEDNLNTFCHFEHLTDEERLLLARTADDFHNFPLIKCTGCRYCMPCKYGIDIPGIFSFYNKSVNDGTYVSSSEQKGYERERRRYLLSYDKAVPTLSQADHCIACGKCLSACPQRIRIPAELKRIDNYIESLKQELL